MNGRPFSPEEDAAILANPHLGQVLLARLLRRPVQSVRDRRERLRLGFPLTHSAAK